VSFPLRLVIDLVPHEESAAAAATRAQKRAWLIERDYRVIEIAADEVEADPAVVLDRLAQSINP
jgi:tRNA/rRNA methyltransferase